MDRANHSPKLKRNSSHCDKLEPLVADTDDTFYSLKNNVILFKNLYSEIASVSNLKRL